MSMNLDIATTMVLVKGDDRTESISWLDNTRKKQWVEVQYKGNLTIYTYSSQNIVILRNPKSINIEHCLVNIKGVSAYKVSKVLKFGTRCRIIYENGKCETVLFQDISFIKNQAEQPCISQILNYLREISQYTNDFGHEEAFLKKEMDRLTFVNSESALCYYMKGNHSKIKSIDINKIIFPFSYNLSQKDALEKALTSVISVIDGPPGTGKTQTILNLIANLVTVYDKSVAVVSSNDKAVKNIIEKMQKNNYEFIMAMLGNNKNQRQFFDDLPKAKFGDWNCIETQENLHQKINALNTKLNHLLKIDRRRACLENELQQWELEQKYFEEYYKQQNIEQIIKLPLFWATPERILSFLAETYLAEEMQKSNGMIYKIKLFIKYGIIDYSKLCEEETLLFLSLQKEFYIRQISSLRDQKDALQSKLDNVSFESLLKEHQMLSKRLFQKYLYIHYHQTKKANFSISNYKAKFAEFIKTYPVILSTTNSLRRSLPENYLLDYVIIDEASKVDLITGVLALSCCRNVVIVGDEKQLPQITDSGIEKRIKTCLTNHVYNYFKHNILSSVIELYGNKLERTILREHYRCHPVIIGYCNQKYYNDQLIPFTSSELSSVPMLIYETAEGNHMRKVTEGNAKGNYNRRELEVTVEEVLKSNGSIDKFEHIGFITPFRLQADKAGELLNEKVESDTVHKYQGREKEVMIMSTVLDNKRSGYMGMRFVDDPKLINVAVSRAVKQFILVTNRELFLKKQSEIGDLIRYIEYSNPDNNVIKSNIVSVFDLLYKNYSNRLIPLKRKMNKNARFKSQEIVRVLLDKVFNEEQYNMCFYAEEMLVRNLIRDISQLTKEELQYVNNRASLDFVIYRKIGKSCVMAIEVDGFKYHENNPKQLNRDRLKNSILEKYKIPLLRLPKKYYSCFPLLLNLGILMINHVELLKDPRKTASLTEEAKVLFIRIREECDDVSITRQALFMEALCSLISGDANTVLELLAGSVAPALPPESLLASAYQTTGRTEEAKSVLQVGMFQNIVVLFNFFPAYLTLCADDPSKFEEVLQRSLVVAETFDMRHLHPGVLVGLYIAAAQGFIAQKNYDKALEMLQKYTEIVISDIYPLRLHGDAFFDRLDGWLGQLDLGTDLPRDEKTIRKSMSDVIVNNPVFSVLSDEQRFQSITEKLQHNCK